MTPRHWSTMMSPNQRTTTIEQIKRSTAALPFLNPKQSIYQSHSVAIATALKIHIGDSVPCLAGQTTHSGGGGALHGLRDHLPAEGVVIQSMYLVAPCSLHAVNKALENSIKAAFGEAKIEARNAMKAIYTCYIPLAVDTWRDVSALLGPCQPKRRGSILDEDANYISLVGRAHNLLPCCQTLATVAPTSSASDE